MDKKRALYNLRMVVSLFLAIASAISFANYYFDLGYFGNSAKGVLYGVGLIGLFFGLFFTPDTAEFREHGWWWKEGS